MRRSGAWKRNRMGKEAEALPDLFVHRSMGEKVLSRLPLEMPEKDVFRYALSGPDDWATFQFYVPWRWKKYRGRAGIMHEEKTGEFLNALAKTAREAEGREKNLLFAYTAGFLCHFYLDSGTHPYILARACGNASNHTALERELDRLEMERQGIGGKRPLSSLLTLQALPSEMKGGLEAAYRVYGWNPVWQDLNTALKDAGRFLRLAEDPYGVWNRLFFWWRRMRVFSYRCIAYHGEDPENTSRNVGKDRFPEMVEQSVARAAERILRLHRYVYEDGDWEAMPDISYTTGK